MSVDVIVVGVGAAGPVIAARLGDDPAVPVALREDGGENIHDVGRMQGAFFCSEGSPMDRARKMETESPRFRGGLAA